MRRIYQFAALAAAFGLLWVLITPAPDELPTTAGAKARTLPGLVATSTLFALVALSFGHYPLHTITNFFSTPHVLSFTCALLC